MAGVFEVEVDGVEHDHGPEHHEEPIQVRVTASGQIKQIPRSSVLASPPRLSLAQRQQLAAA